LQKAFGNANKAKAIEKLTMLIIKINQDSLLVTIELNEYLKMQQ